MSSLGWLDPGCRSTCSAACTLLCWAPVMVCMLWPFCRLQSRSTTGSALAPLIAGTWLSRGQGCRIWCTGAACTAGDWTISAGSPWPRGVSSLASACCAMAQTPQCWTAPGADQQSCVQGDPAVGDMRLAGQDSSMLTCWHVLLGCSTPAVTKICRSDAQPAS